MQNFKGDDLELKMKSVADPLFSVIDVALDEFYAGGFGAVPFVEMLRSEGRIPFSLKIKEEFFTLFFLEAIANFPFVGNFESYILILRAVFGDQTEIIFEVPGPGLLTINVNFFQTEFELIGRIFVDDAYEIYNIASQDEEQILAVGLTGIETVEELALLFSEITPEGIFQTLNLNAYDFPNFAVADAATNLYDVVDHDGNILYFKEPV